MNNHWNKCGIARNFLCGSEVFSGLAEMKDAARYLEMGSSLRESVIFEFGRGRELIASLDDLAYTRSTNGTGSVGGHFRHNLDFVNNFLNGVAVRQIDYNGRERDMRIETDRGYATRKLDLAMMRIRSLDDEILQGKIYVRSEVDPTGWLPSSGARELEFIHSHTVHHHALIAEKLAVFGIAVTKTFGVAPSTLQYWKTKTA